jgi:hypothetical protein
LLLDAGAPIGWEIFHHLNPFRQFLEKQEIMTALVSELGKRRILLQELATQELAQEDLLLLDFGQDTILDSKTFRVLQLLDEHGVPVPSQLRCADEEGETVYHTTPFNKRLTQCLFDAGFREVDQSCNELTPLMGLGDPFLENALLGVCWFLQKGADLHKPIPIGLLSGNGRVEPDSDQTYRVVHMVAFGLGLNTEAQYISRSLDPDAYAVACELFLDDKQDPCICGCSSRGCVSIVQLTKSYCSKYPKPRWPRKPGITGIASFLSDIHASGRNLEGSNQAMKSFIRVLTFNRLGLTHTCCKYKSGRVPYRRPALVLMVRDEIEEIQEEERFRRAELESLI